MLKKKKTRQKFNPILTQEPQKETSSNLFYFFVRTSRTVQHTQETALTSRGKKSAQLRSGAPLYVTAVRSKRGCLAQRRERTTATRGITPNRTYIHSSKKTKRTHTDIDNTKDRPESKQDEIMFSFFKNSKRCCAVPSSFIYHGCTRVKSRLPSPTRGESQTPHSVCQNRPTLS